MVLMNRRPNILLTNDDGIRSPGLWAAAATLARLGFVTVAAPRDQASGMGRSLPSTSDGLIHEERVQVNGREWTAYAVGGSPAQAVLHAILEIMPEPPDLVVSGINYGENVGLGVTISGTVGAALEGAALGYPALAVSLEVHQQYHLSYSEEIDFEPAAHFTEYFARILLERKNFNEVDVLKIDVPTDAGIDTPWEVTRLARQRYYEPVKPVRSSWDQPATVGYREASELEHEGHDTDVYVLRGKRLVSVTPLSLDLTARVDLPNFEKDLRE
jgi:5'-nucleotidase